MSYLHSGVIRLLQNIDFGSSVAEQDALLEKARVETSVFTDLLRDKVDLIPGTKGSGKSALYRIIVDFLPDYLLQQNKVVVAHGIQRHGDQVFNAFSAEFSRMTEEDFVSFWCLYLISLANEHFIKNPKYSSHLQNCTREVAAFRSACKAARIPSFDTPMMTLRDVLGWCLAGLRSWKPRLTYTLPDGGGKVEAGLFGEPTTAPKQPISSVDNTSLPAYAQSIKYCIENVLDKAGLSLWLMVDRLDELFQRRSQVETRALRGLLKTLRIFESSIVRVKVFLRDDILSQITAGRKGFTALTHITSRQSDTLRWEEKQILTMIVNRIYVKESVMQALDVDPEKLKASGDYRNAAFYKVFPPTVHRGTNQSPTLRWLYTHTADGNGVVTPRDVIDLLTRARQKQLDLFTGDLSGESDYIICPAAIRYGHEEMSKRKRVTFLDAEFPHLARYIKKFDGRRTQYSEADIKRLFGAKWTQARDHLISIGLLKQEGATFKIPFLYRAALSVKQGKA